MLSSLERNNLLNDLITINEELTRLIGALRTAINGFETAIKDAAEKRTQYDVEWAKALLSIGEGTQKVKEAEATLIVQSFMREARIAEATRDAFKERVRAIETTITVQQSRLKFITDTESSNY